MKVQVASAQVELKTFWLQWPGDTKKKFAKETRMHNSCPVSDQNNFVQVMHLEKKNERKKSSFEQTHSRFYRSRDKILDISESFS